MIYAVFILIIITLCICIYSVSKKTSDLRKKLEQSKEELAKELLYEQQEKINQKKGEVDKIQQELRLTEEFVNTRRESAEKEIQHLQENQKQIIKQQEEIIDEKLLTHFTEQKRVFESNLKQSIDILKEQANEQYEQDIAQYNINILEMTGNLVKLQEEVQEWQIKRDAINQDIVRQRQVEEQQDFFRVNLTQQTIEDIKILLEAKSKLHSHENLDKLIYDGYVAKAVLEMTKRVLHGNAPCGIYKITRLTTGEIYIGQSTDIKARWQQHCKSCFNVGNIAHSILHTTMQKDGIEKFTFELLEECPKDKLTEREKYWIEFFDSKRYGLNMREG